MPTGDHIRVRSAGSPAACVSLDSSSRSVGHNGRRGVVGYVVGKEVIREHAFCAKAAA